MDLTLHLCVVYVSSPSPPHPRKITGSTLRNGLWHENTSIVDEQNKLINTSCFTFRLVTFAVTKRAYLILDLPLKCQSTHKKYYTAQSTAQQFSMSLRTGSLSVLFACDSDIAARSAKILARKTHYTK